MTPSTPPQANVNSVCFSIIGLAVYPASSTISQLSWPNSNLIFPDNDMYDPVAHLHIPVSYARSYDSYLASHPLNRNLPIAMTSGTPHASIVRFNATHWRCTTYLRQLYGQSQPLDLATIMTPGTPPQLVAGDSNIGFMIWDWGCFFHCLPGIPANLKS